MSNIATLRNAILSTVVLAGMIGSSGIAEARRSRPKPKPQPTTQPVKTDQNTPGKFDYYALTLSWSPDYCAAKGGNDPQQCGAGKKLGFVLHGLWPQYDRGYPQSCTNEAFDPKMQTQFPNLYPSTKLYTHEWEKHGTCSGLTQPQYHQLAQTLKSTVKIPDRYQTPVKPIRLTPDEFNKDFVNANPAYTDKSFAPTCSGSGRFLQEVIVCHSQDGKPGICSDEVLKRSKKSCGQSDFLLRSVR